MGTVNDYVGEHSLIKTKWKKPILWARIAILSGFLISASVFYIMNTQKGITHSFIFDPFFLEAEFNTHYKHVWMVDIFAAAIFAFVLDKRWFCKNLCAMGLLCAAGSRYSRLLPVIDTDKCTRCLKCEKECLTGIPITEYIDKDKGLITNPECILCGKCVNICNLDAVTIRFIWSRKKFREKENDSRLVS